MKQLFSFLQGKPKLLDEKTYEKAYFQLMKEESWHLFFTKSGKPTDYYRNYAYTFHQRHFLPLIQECFDIPQLKKTNQTLAKQLERLLKEFYEDLLQAKARPLTLEYVRKEDWENTMFDAIRRILKPENIEAEAKKIIQTMPEKRLKQITKEVAKEVFHDLEIAYRDKVLQLEQEQQTLLQQVKNIEQQALQKAKAVAEQQSQQTFEQQSKELMKELFPLDNDFFRKDKTRSYYYENLKKEGHLKDAERELDYREKELQFQNREMGLREKSFELSHREKEQVLKVIEQDLEIKRKSLELVQTMNVYELNHKELEIAYRLLAVEKEGINQTKELLSMEQTLLEVRHAQFDDKVRDIVFDIQRQKFDLRKLESKLDYQKRELNVYKLVQKTNDELSDLEYQKDNLYGEIRNLNTEVSRAYETNYELETKRKLLLNNIEQLQAKK